MPNYDLKYFFDKFTAIPEERWCEVEFEDKKGRKCAAGHCGYTKEAYGAECQALHDLFKAAGWLITAVNDGRHTLFSQRSPKARILAAVKYLMDHEKTKIETTKV